MDLEKVKKVIKEAIREKVNFMSEYLAEQGVQTLLYVIDDLPIYGTDFHNYVREKARADLPACQFTGMVNPKNLADFVEIGGTVGYNEGLFEIRYNKSDIHNVTLEKTSKGDHITSSLIRPDIDFQGLAKSNVVLDWHTHPLPSPPSIDDFNNMLRFDQMLKRHFYDKSVEFALYLPTFDEVHWFGMQTKSE